MRRATLRQLLWVCIIWAVKVEARLTVTPEEKQNRSLVNPYYELCEQIQCLRVEDVFTKTVDLWENPCADYYAYACKHSYKPFGDHAPFSNEANKVFIDLEEILAEDLLTRKLDQGNEALAIERKIFKLCKSGGDAFDLGEKQHYANVLSNFGANRLLHTHTFTLTESRRWDEADLRYAQKGFGFTFFDVDIYQHINEDFHGRHQPKSARYILIKPPTYSVTQLSELLLKYFNKQPRSSHSYTNNRYEKLTAFISSFHTYVQGAQSTEITFKNIKEWQDFYNSHATAIAKINWLDYLIKLFNAARVQASLHAGTTIAIQHQDYFLKLARFLKDNADNDLIVDYVHLHFVSKSVGLADRNFTEYSILPQFKGMVCTPGLLIGATYKYADEHFPEENRKLLVDLISRVKDAVIARVEDAIRKNTKFPSADTQNMLRDFLDEYKNAEIYAGYPDWLMNGTAAYSIYGHSAIGPFSSLYDYQVAVIERLLRAKLLPLVTPSMPIIDLTELRRGFESNKIEIIPHTKKEESSEQPQKSQNSEKTHKDIVIPFGYFNERDYRFFSSQLFDPINYGAAATEVAFILYSDLMDSIHYQDIAPRCVQDQVPDHAVSDAGEYVKRAATYLLALEAAHKSWPSKNSYPIQFVDFGAMSDSDLFFLSFAESLCTIPPRLNSEQTARDLKKERSYYRIDDQLNLLPRYINFTLQNFPPFLENHMCQKNHKISTAKSYSEKRCDPLNFSSP